MIPQFIFVGSPSSSPISVAYDEDEDEGFGLFKNGNGNLNKGFTQFEQEELVATLSPFFLSAQLVEYSHSNPLVEIKEDEETEDDVWTRTVEAWTPGRYYYPPSASSIGKSRRPIVRKTVRGLWKDNSRVRILSDALLCRVFGNLNVADLVSCEQVSQRWKAVSERDWLWENMDASEFVRSLPGNAMDTTKTLTQRIRAVTTTIRIERIGTCLSADYLHIPFWNLRHLYLSGFAELTDTHVQSLLILATFRTHDLPLESIHLVECPKLNIENCHRLISLLCPKVRSVRISN